MAMSAAPTQVYLACMRLVSFFRVTDNDHRPRVWVRRRVPLQAEVRRVSVRPSAAHRLPPRRGGRAE